jgi:hypothetical protein
MLCCLELSTELQFESALVSGCVTCTERKRRAIFPVFSPRNFDLRFLNAEALLRFDSSSVNSRISTEHPKFKTARAAKRSTAKMSILKELPEVLQYEVMLKQKKAMFQCTFQNGDLLAIVPSDSKEAEELLKKQNTETYEMLHNNGFFKLYRKPTGRFYWHLQGMAAYKVLRVTLRYFAFFSFRSEFSKLPDWKLHVSVARQDYARAWNLLVRLFIGHHCRAGMKLEDQLDEWPAYQRGREFTVYILQHAPMFDEHGGPTREDQQPGEFWHRLIADIEAAFTREQITSNGCADGDLAIGRYVSIRNESFVNVNPSWLPLPSSWSLSEDPTTEQQTCYPPNAAGWNAAQHPLPFAVNTSTRSTLRVVLMLSCIALALAVSAQKLLR